MFLTILPEREMVYVFHFDSGSLSKRAHLVSVRLSTWTLTFRWVLIFASVLGKALSFLRNQKSGKGDSFFPGERGMPFFSPVGFTTLLTWVSLI